jgi:S-DNA-T family DNA segregation ATPase FtsK/SpoIIIE
MLLSDPAAAPPRLVVVIDEFAVAARDLPGFVDGVVDLAQRGRSLGIHLVLATQRPAGVVTDRIRANVNLRIALRVADAAESVDVLGTSDAASIPSANPGRAYVRAGSAAPLLVQTAHSGARSRRRDPDDIAVRTLERTGRSAPDAAPQTGPTDLDVVVDAIGSAAAAAGRTSAERPWVAPLPEALPLGPGAPDVQPAAPLAVAIGLVDRPDVQAQPPLTIDLARCGNVACFGTTHAGTTTFLRTLAVALARGAGPRDLHLYGLDLGPPGLGPIAALPHCGAVVDGGDDERVRRLLRMLRREVAERRRRMTEAAASSLDDLRSVSGATIADTVLLLDGYGALHAAYERIELGAILDDVVQLAADGPSVGIHLAVTADRRGALPTKLAGVITTRLVLRLAGDDEYGAFGIRRDAAAPPPPPGRAVTDEGHDAQIAVVGPDPSVEAQAAAIAELATTLGPAPASGGPPPVRRLPARIAVSDLPPPTDAAAPVIGIGDDALGPAVLDLRDGHALIAGPPGSGRSTALLALAESILRAADPPEVVVLRSRPPRAADRIAPGARVVHGDDVGPAAAALAAALDLHPAQDGPPSTVVLVDDADLLAESPASASLEQLARRGRDLGVRVVAAVEARSALRSFGGLVPELRKHRRGVLLEPDTEVDGDLLGVRLPRRPGQVPRPGLGYLVDRGTLQLVQLAVPGSG